MEHGSSTLPIQEALRPTRRARRTTGPCGTRRCGTGCGSSPCRARTSRRPTNRVDLDPAVRDAWGFPAGRVTYAPHRHELVASAHWGPVLEAVHARRRRRLVLLQHVAAARRARHRSTRAPARAWPPRPSTSWAPAGWATDPATSVVGPESRFHDVENLLCADSSVFVTVRGLQPDAHPRRPRPPGGVAARRHPAAGHRTRLTGRARSPREIPVQALNPGMKRPMGPSWDLVGRSRGSARLWRRSSSG